MSRDKDQVQSARKHLAEAMTFLRSMEVRDAVALLSVDQLIGQQIQEMEGSESKRVVSQTVYDGKKKITLTLRLVDAQGARKRISRLSRLDKLSATVDGLTELAKRVNQDHVQRNS